MNVQILYIYLNFDSKQLANLFTHKLPSLQLVKQAIKFLHDKIKHLEILKQFLGNNKF